MSRAIEMKNLVSDIKASTEDRIHFVAATKTATHQLLEDIKERIDEIAKDVQQLIVDFVKAGKERTKEYHELLAQFDKAMKDIQAKIKDIAHETKQLIARFKKESGERADDVKDLLAEYDKALEIMAKELKDFLMKSEDTRLADFDITIKDVQGQVKAVVKDAHEVMEQNLEDIHAIQKEVKDLLQEYAEEGKETSHAWEPIRKKWAEMTAEAGETEKVEEIPLPHKRGRKKK